MVACDLTGDETMKTTSLLKRIDVRNLKTDRVMKFLNGLKRPGLSVAGYGKSHPPVMQNEQNSHDTTIRETEV